MDQQWKKLHLFMMLLQLFVRLAYLCTYMYEDMHGGMHASGKVFKKLVTIVLYSQDFLILVKIISICFLVSFVAITLDPTSTASGTVASPNAPLPRRILGERLSAPCGQVHATYPMALSIPREKQPQLVFRINVSMYMCLVVVGGMQVYASVSCVHDLLYVGVAALCLYTSSLVCLSYCLFRWAWPAEGPYRDQICEWSGEPGTKPWTAHVSNQWNTEGLHNSEKAKDPNHQSLANPNRNHSRNAGMPSNMESACRCSCRWRFGS